MPAGQEWPVDRLRPHKLDRLVPPLAANEFRLLVADIGERGVQEPLQVSPTGVVLDGRARLTAAIRLGLAVVPIRIAAPADEAEFVALAALRRRQLTPSQRAALALELEDYQAAARRGERRRRANLRRGPEVAPVPPREAAGGKSRAVAAALADVGQRTVQDAKAVRDADPELFAQIKAGSVVAKAAARLVRQRALHESIPPAPPLPKGPFDVVYADPPWPLGNSGSEKAPDNHYPTMSFGEIAALRVPVAEHAALFLWVPSSLLVEGLKVMLAWGFEYRTSLVWVKDRIGLGQWVRTRHELLLLGRRGAFSVPPEASRPDSVIEAPRGRHSEKPLAAYERIEQMYPRCSKVELFARRARPGWTSWGNQAPQ
jgi:N6-adenosine-specific RNA methylase IME4/ParB-like chromosome segregation protein Spo0J